MWKNWFYFSLEERRVVWLFLFIIAVTMSVRYVGKRELRLQSQIDSLNSIISSHQAVTPTPNNQSTTPIRSDIKPKRETDQTKKRSTITPSPPIASTQSNSRTFKPSNKFVTPTRLCLNSTDSLELQRVPGIGPVYAQAIIRYRERLGGYLDIGQLNEITVIRPQSLQQIKEWLTIESLTLSTLNINRATFKELVRHPYIGYERAKLISNYIRKSGDLSSLSLLSSYNEFDSLSIGKIAPYVRFKD